MHLSPPNHSDKSRLIYTFHIIEGEGAEYDERNWWVHPEGIVVDTTGCNRLRRCHSLSYSNNDIC